jgi:hypothetical protein
MSAKNSECLVVNNSGTVDNFPYVPDVSLQFPCISYDIESDKLTFPKGKQSTAFRKIEAPDRNARFQNKRETFTMIARLPTINLRLKQCLLASYPDLLQKKDEKVLESLIEQLVTNLFTDISADKMISIHAPDK